MAKHEPNNLMGHEYSSNGRADISHRVCIVAHKDIPGYFYSHTNRNHAPVEDLAEPT